MTSAYDIGVKLAFAEAGLAKEAAPTSFRGKVTAAMLAPLLAMTGTGPRIAASAAGALGTGTLAGAAKAEAGTWARLLGNPKELPHNFAQAAKRIAPFVEYTPTYKW